MDEVSDTPEHINKCTFLDDSRKLKQSERVLNLTQLDIAEKARDGFRQACNWQRYSEMSLECGRIGRLINLEEQQQNKE